jgi:hypothetical protein
MLRVEPPFDDFSTDVCRVPEFLSDFDVCSLVCLHSGVNPRPSCSFIS